MNNKNHLYITRNNRFSKLWEKCGENLSLWKSNKIKQYEQCKILNQKQNEFTNDDLYPTQNR